MAAKSKHWKDVSDWLFKVVDSCTTMRQLMSAQKLINLYKNKYPKKRTEYVQLSKHLTSKYYCIVEHLIDI